MSYLVTTGQGRWLFDDLDEAYKHAESVGGDLWVSYDDYMQQVDPEYKLFRWLEYLWKKLRK